MRTRQEILFRLKQEGMNLRFFLWGAPITPGSSLPGALPGLPDPKPVLESLRDSDFAAEVIGLAEGFLEQRFPLMTLETRTGAEIDWQSDPTRSDRKGLGWLRRAHYRLVPYMDVERLGDYKIIFELNRHQHFPLLAQAWRWTGRREFLQEIERQILSWRLENPMAAGINWASALEPAFRSLSWIWTWQLASEGIGEEARRALLDGIEEHAWFLEYNLSFYHSPNTHLLGESLALEAIGTVFPHFRRSSRWRALGRSTLDHELDVQVYRDGGHFELSTAYHVYTLDMFLLHGLLAARQDAGFREKLGRMARYLAAVMGPERRLPFIGDDDGGRLFHPYGHRELFGRATLTTCGILLGNAEWIGPVEEIAQQAAWWIGASALGAPGGTREAKHTSVFFPDTGIAVINSGDLHLVLDGGPLSIGSAGHSHADTLSLILRCGNEDILIDPGTYTYIVDPKDRDSFRGTAAHNTIRIDERDQAVPLGPFRWVEKPEVQIVDWASESGLQRFAAVCRYRGFTHARAFAVFDRGLVAICDRLDGPRGVHRIERFWHAGVPVERHPARNDCLRFGSCTWLVNDSGEVELSTGGEFGWRSPGLGTRFPSPVVRISENQTFPLWRWTVFDGSGEAGTLTAEGGSIIYLSAREKIALRAEVLAGGCIKIVA